MSLKQELTDLLRNRFSKPINVSSLRQREQNFNYIRKEQDINELYTRLLNQDDLLDMVDSSN